MTLEGSRLAVVRALGDARPDRWRIMYMTGQADSTEITFEFLDAFAAAWNRHDVDAIMSALTNDCVFEASAGVGVKGTVYDGQRQVRKGVEAVFGAFPDAKWAGPKHFIAGNR